MANIQPPKTNNILKKNNQTKPPVVGNSPVQPQAAITNSELNALTKELSNNLGPLNITPNNKLPTPVTPVTPVTPPVTPAPPTPTQPLNANLNPSELANINNLTKLSNEQISKMSERDINSLLKRLETQNKKLSNEINLAKSNSTATNINKKSEVETPSKPQQQQSEPTQTIIQVITPEPSKWSNFFKILLIVIVVLLIVLLIRYLIGWYQSSTYNIPYLIPNTKNAKYPVVISQDPTNTNYIPIRRSDGQSGIQFTYGFWFIIDNFDYKKGEWKHVFHKGNDSAYPNRAPGVWINPTTNSMRVYMNTQDNIMEYVDVDNIPLRKWVYMNIILSQNTTDENGTPQTPSVANLDIYINGYLKVRKQLSSLPKQNDDDLWVNMYGGFEGYLSNLKYYPYAIDYSEISKSIKTGPSGGNCIDTGEIPPYLDDNWWYADKTF